MIQIEDLHLWQWDTKEVGSIKLFSKNSNEMTPVWENESVPLSCMAIFCQITNGDLM